MPRRKRAVHDDVSDSLSARRDSVSGPSRTIAGLRAIAEALFTTEAGPPPRERLDWLASEMTAFLVGVPGWVLRVLVFVVNRLAPLLIGRFTSLSGLSVGDRIRALSTLERRVGAALVPVKALLCLVYYEHPDARAEVRIDGGCLGQTPARPAAP